MRCERCNKNEATFYYSSNINGRRTERHLCADCARAEGLGGALDYQSSFGSMFSDPFFGDMFSDFFSPLRSFGSFGGGARSIMAPSVTRIGFDAVQPQVREPLEDSELHIPADAGDDVKHRRRVEALRQQMEEAVKREDFEKAAQLRDSLRQLEGGR